MKASVLQLRFLVLMAAIIFLGAGCRGAGAPQTSLIVEENPTELKVYTWNVANLVLKKDTIVSFSYPAHYSVSEDKQSNYARLIIKGPAGRVEIANIAYYDGLPAPAANPTPAQQKEYDEQLPKDGFGKGWQGDFSIDTFYSVSNSTTPMELRKIMDSIVIEDLSQQP